MAGEMFEAMMKDNIECEKAFHKNPAFREMLANLFVALNELARRKGVQMEDMEIINPTISNDGRKIRIVVAPMKKALDNISPILGADGQNIRRDKIG